MTITNNRYNDTPKIYFRNMVFSILWNLANQDPYEPNDLGQACRMSNTNDGPAVQLGCLADASGKSWETFRGKKIAPAKLEPYWENPSGSANGSTWQNGPGTHYY